MGMGSYKKSSMVPKEKGGREKEKRTEKPQKKGQTGVWREKRFSLFIYDPVYSRPSNGYYSTFPRIPASRLPNSATHVPRQSHFLVSPPLPAPVPPVAALSVVIVLFSLPFFLLRVDPNSIILLFCYC